MNSGARLWSSVRRAAISRDVVTRSSLPSRHCIHARTLGRTRTLQFSTGPSTWQRKYSKRHEWISTTSGGKKERVGTTSYAQDALGDIVFVQLPDVGAKVKRYDECGAVESVKAATDIYAPLDGTVTSVNPEVESTPGLINSSPYDKGWIFTLTLDNVKDYDLLMDEEEYKKFLDAEKPI